MANLQDAVQIDRALGGEEVGALLVVPRPVLTTDGVMVSDRPAGSDDRIPRRLTNRDGGRNDRLRKPRSRQTRGGV